MIDPAQLAEHVIAPMLQHIGLDSLAARRLLLGTAMTESGLVYLRQVGGGPALGLWQMEPATHNDTWVNFLSYRPVLADKVDDLYPSGEAQAEYMAGNLYYACAMARIRYYRVPDPLPPEGDATAMAAYWKRFYNTEHGAGTLAHALPNFVRAIDVVKG